jgi:translation initiation factor IF-2
MKQIQKVIDELTKKVERLEIDKSLLTREIYTIYSVIDSLNEAINEGNEGNYDDDLIKFDSCGTTTHSFKSVLDRNKCAICGFNGFEHIKHNQ